MEMEGSVLVSELVDSLIMMLHNEELKMIVKAD